MYTALDIAVVPSPVVLWRDSIEAMPVQGSPCRFLAVERWARLRHSALDFIERFGDEAHGLGWTTADLFGVDPHFGTRRTKRCGALMVDGRAVYRLELHRVRFTISSGSGNRFDQQAGVPVWEFAGNGAARV